MKHVSSSTIRSAELLLDHPASAASAAAYAGCDVRRPLALGENLLLMFSNHLTPTLPPTLTPTQGVRDPRARGLSRFRWAKCALADLKSTRRRRFQTKTRSGRGRSTWDCETLQRYEYRSLGRLVEKIKRVLKIGH